MSKKSLFSLVFASCMLCGFGIASADAAEPPAEQPPFDSSPGMSATRPESGPAVQVEHGFMVPYTERIPGTDITFEMIPVPGGTFTMGSPESEPERAADEGPQVKVNVPPMWVAKEEVSWAEYSQYMDLYAIFKAFEARGIRPVTDENRVDAVTAPTELYEPSFTFEYGQEDDQSAVTMTQFAARQYSKWLSHVTGRQYRLPTEAEWEYAARGGTQTAFSWGDDPEKIDEYAWYFDNADAGQLPGAQKKPNPFGLYDMHGNVAEWTVDAYSEAGYELPTDRVLTVDEAVRWPEESYPGVVRGGSWEMEPPQMRSAARLASDDEYWKEEDPNYPKSPWWFTSDPARGVGFRLFRSFKPKSEEGIAKFWEMNTEDVEGDVQSRISGGRGVYGIVDKDLPAAIKAADEK